MQFCEIILYSFTQGVTEFLPISSSAHLFILEHLLNWPVSGRSMAIAAHLGSLHALSIYLKEDILKIFYSFYYLIAADAHLFPAPKAFNIILSPLTILPSSFASH